jgi:hypothetical protein
MPVRRAARAIAQEMTMTQHPFEPDVEVTIAAEAASELEANLLVAILAEAGIEARAAGALSANFRAEVPGRVRVFVRRAQAEAARDAIAAARAEAAEIDWSQIDVGEPEE